MLCDWIWVRIRIRRWRPGGPAAPEYVVQMRKYELDVRIREILHDEVASMFRPQITKMFGSIMTAMVEYFNERYADLAEMAATVAASDVTTAR